MLIALPLAGGCASTSLDSAVKRIFEPKKTPQQYMILAVSDADPDVRRESVGKIANSDLHDKEWAIKGYSAIALLEDGAQTRCVAIRALAQTRDPRAVEVFLKIINHESQPPAEVRPPDALVLAETVRALGHCCAWGLLENMKDPVRSTFAEQLSKAASRDVRAAAAQGLGWFAAEPVVDALIVGLSDDDFVVAHACEDSLVRLTGETHDCNAASWRAWAAQNRGRYFVRAGNVPDSKRPKYTNRWEKAAYDTKQVARWLFPGPKPK